MSIQASHIRPRYPAIREGHETVTNKIGQMVAGVCGEYGFEVLTGTGENTGDWTAIQAISGNAAFTTTSGTNLDDLAGLTLLDGTIVYGRFTKVTLSSGTLLAYKSSP